MRPELVRQIMPGIPVIRNTTRGGSARAAAKPVQRTGTMRAAGIGRVGLGGRDQPFNAGLAVDHDARAEGHGALVCPDQVRGPRTEGFRLEGSSLVQLHVG